MQPVVITQSWKRMLVFLAGALAFVATGILIIRLGGPGSGFVGWMSIVFFGGCALIFLWRLADNRPRITITDRGIEDRFLKIGVVEWADIADVQLWRQSGSAFIGLALRDEHKYIARLSPLMQRMAALNEKLGYPRLCINLAATNAVPEQIEFVIVEELEFRSRHAAVMRSLSDHATPGVVEPTDPRFPT